MEEDFKKAINIANFIIEKHSEVFEELVNIQEELNQVDMERNALTEQHEIDQDEIKELHQRNNEIQ